MTHFFISYAKKDTRELALALADALNTLEGVSAWVDRSLKAGRSWELQIQTEIDRCDSMIVLYSPDINRHLEGQDESYVLTEIAYARYTRKKPIIPVMAQKTIPPMSLTTIQYIDYTLPNVTLADLIAAICEEADIAQHTQVQTLPDSPQRRMNWDNLAPELAAKIALARQFKGTRNADWTPLIVKLGEIEPTSPLSELEMCLIPVGKFSMGGDYGKPLHEQIMTQPYFLARYPVTNAQWRLGVAAGIVREPSDSTWYQDKSLQDCPVVYVDWFECRKFALWAMCELPTEPQWEYAARGLDNLHYPWGNDWESGQRAIWEGNSSGTPQLVTSKPKGASWVGAEQLSGNVWEWLLSVYQDYPYRAEDGREANLNSLDALHVLRGGSWYDFTPHYFYAHYRNKNHGYSWVNDWGFRLVY